MSDEWVYVKKSKRRTKVENTSEVIEKKNSWDMLPDDDPDAARSRQLAEQREVAAAEKAAKHVEWVRKPGKKKQPQAAKATRAMVEVASELTEDVVADWLAQAQSVSELGDEAIGGTLHAALDAWWRESTPSWRVGLMEGTGTKAALEGPIALMKAQPCARLVKAFRGLDGAVVARLLHKCSEVLRESLCTGSDKDAQLCTGAAVTVQVLLAAKPGLLSEETLRNLVMKKDSKGKWKDAGLPLCIFLLSTLIRRDAVRGSALLATLIGAALKKACQELRLCWTCLEQAASALRGRRGAEPTLLALIGSVRGCHLPREKKKLSENARSRFYEAALSRGAGIDLAGALLPLCIEQVAWATALCEAPGIDELRAEVVLAAVETPGPSSRIAANPTVAGVWVTMLAGMDNNQAKSMSELLERATGRRNAVRSGFLLASCVVLVLVVAGMYQKLSPDTD